MQLLKKGERFGEFAFGLAIWIHLIIMVIGYGEWVLPLQGRLMQVAFALFCVKVLTTFYSKKQWIFMIILGLVGVISYVFSKEEYVISVVVMVFAAVGIDMRKWCKVILIMALLTTAITALLSLVGIGGIPVDVRDYGRGGVEARWCLGFGHANNFHGTLWYLLLLFMYLCFSKLNWGHYLIFTLVNTAVYCLTISKAGFLVVQITIVMAFLMRYIRKLQQNLWMYILAAVGVLGVYVISFVSVSIEWIKSPFLMFLDKLFTGRINLAYQYAHISTWELLTSAGELGIVDNGFVAMFFRYGYVVGILYMFFFLYMLYLTWKEKNGLLLIIFVTSVLYTFMEATYMTNVAYLLSNAAYIAAMILLADKKEQINESEQLKN